MLLVVTRETYAPTILAKKARARRAETDDPRWWCRYEEKTPLLSLLKVNLSRPFGMAFTEPICIFWNLYVSLIYGILYLCFVAYPIVFTGLRGWSISFSGLAFVGIGTGSMIAILMEPLIRRIIEAQKKDLESVMFPCCIAAVLVPIGQLWFAWTSAPPVHWVWPILAGIPFGSGKSPKINLIYSINYVYLSFKSSAGTNRYNSHLHIRRKLSGQWLWPVCGERISREHLYAEHTGWRLASGWASNVSEPRSSLGWLLTRIFASCCDPHTNFVLPYWGQVESKEHAHHPVES